MAELKACPFCGSKDLTKRIDYETGGIFITCCNCYAGGPQEGTDTNIEIKDYMDAWNKRS